MQCWEWSTRSTSCRERCAANAAVSATGMALLTSALRLLARAATCLTMMTILFWLTHERRTPRSKWARSWVRWCFSSAMAAVSRSSAIPPTPVARCTPPKLPASSFTCSNRMVSTTGMSRMYCTSTCTGIVHGLQIYSHSKPNTVIRAYTITYPYCILYLTTLVILTAILSHKSNRTRAFCLQSYYVRSSLSLPSSVDALTPSYELLLRLMEVWFTF